MAYYFMLGAIPLPITPGALEVTTPSKNETIVLINDGEINIPKTKGLREISFEFLIPTLQKYPFSNYQLNKTVGGALLPALKLASPVLDKLKDSAGGLLGSLTSSAGGLLGSITSSAGDLLGSIMPSGSGGLLGSIIPSGGNLLDSVLPSIPDMDLGNFGTYTAGTLIPLIETMKKTKKTFPFIVTRMSPKGKYMSHTSIMCTIETFTFKEDAEEYGFDYLCSITLKEYVPYATKRIKIDKNKAKVITSREWDGKLEEKAGSENESILSSIVKKGQSIVGGLLDSAIKIPETILDYAKGGVNTLTDTIFPDLDLGNLGIVKDAKTILGSVTGTTAQSGNKNQLVSLAETMLKKK